MTSAPEEYVSSSALETLQKDNTALLEEVRKLKEKLALANAKIKKARQLLSSVDLEEVR